MKLTFKTRQSGSVLFRFSIKIKWDSFKINSTFVVTSVDEISKEIRFNFNSKFQNKILWSFDIDFVEEEDFDSIDKNGDGTFNSISSFINKSEFKNRFIELIKSGFINILKLSIWPLTKLENLSHDGTSPSDKNLFSSDIASFL